ncbi:MAG TPA: MFS transporter [Candidatus Methylomirabilis sp.]|nr:MFS transporter [Candidatus Methylomirabilis sp.]
MPFPSGLRALNHRDFRLFWFGQAISLLGTWMQSVGQSWLVLELTNSAFLLGVIGALQFAPILFFSFFAGAVIDRLPKRRLIIGTQTVLLLQALMLSGLAWTGHVRYWHVAALAGLLGTVNTMDMPARQSFMVELAGTEDLMNAIVLNSAAFNGARIVGPAVAGLLVARYGVALAFFLNGVSFVAVIAALLALRTEGRPLPRRGTTLRQEIGEGIRYAVTTPSVSLVLSLLLVVSMLVINHGTLVPLLAREVLHQGARGFGFLMASLGAGALAGAAVLALLGARRPPMALVVVTAAAASAATACMLEVRQVWLAALVLLVIGFAQIVFSASCNTMLQLGVPGELRGRMMSLYAFVFAGVTPIGAILVGSIAEKFGTPMAYGAGGGLGLLSVLVLTARWRHRAKARE